MAEKMKNYLGMVGYKVCWMVFQLVLRAFGLHNGHIEYVG